ncbi:MAG: CotH kinase family protein [Prevotella sp.]|nr:CotH kinase family protein [Prevotella sp.]
MKRLVLMAIVAMCVSSTLKAESSADSVIILKHLKAGEMTPLCLPFDVTDGQLGQLYALGGIEGRRATVYPVSTVSAGCPFVACPTVSTDSIVVAREDLKDEPFEEMELMWDGGMVKGNAEDYSWTFTNIRNNTLRGSHMTYNVLDLQQMDFTVNLENMFVRRFMHDVKYDFDSPTVILDYMKTLADYPNGVTIPLPALTATDEPLKLVYGEGEDLSEATAVDVSAAERSYCIYNLIPQRTYYYRVTQADSVVTQGRFNTTGRVRMIRVPSIRNVRDLGGWRTENGQRTKYGLIYRGGELNGNHVAKEEDIEELKRVGIAAEIDLRWRGENSGAGISAFGFLSSSDVEEGETPSYVFMNNSASSVNNMQNVFYQQRWKTEFEFIVNNLRLGRPVYFHCAWGADRTGILAMLLEGMLGVTFSEMMKDYETTAFGEGSITKAKIQPILDYLNSFEGETFSDKIMSYWLNIVGVAEEDVEYFRSVMLEDDTEEIVPEAFSRTLPVVFVNTTDSIKSKEDYVKATFWLDALDLDEYESVGTKAEPLPLKIRGRGNWTWFGNFRKKPYKIKFEDGQSLLGMGSNKHFALLAHADGDETAYFRNAAGFELGRMVGLDFTPHQQPVELVLNGEYQGLYFLTETVRVGKRRVNITEQKDQEENPDSISGGWLVEIDNSFDDNQVYFPVDGLNLTQFWLTYHSPEKLSNVQFDYLYSQFMDILHAVFTDDKDSQLWEEFIDMTSLAKYYLVNEMLDHCEAFLGSCYLYKDLGETKWKFGPLWDLGHAFNTWHEKDKFLYDYKHETEDDWEICIMEELAKFPRLQKEIVKQWSKAYPAIYDELEDYLTAYAEEIAQAAIVDHEYWKDYGTADIQMSLEMCLERLYEKRDFLVEQWGTGDITNNVSELRRQRTNNVIYNLQGQRIANPATRGVYIKNGKKYSILR